MKKNAPQSFEEALSRLETLTQAMQSSEMPLEDALAAYQEGNEIGPILPNQIGGSRAETASLGCRRTEGVEP